MRLERILVMLLILQAGYLLWRSMDVSGRMSAIWILPFFSPFDSPGMTFTKLFMLIITGYAIASLLKGNKP